MTEFYDVLVAGGGPAGLTAARDIAASGMDVLVLELQAQIGGPSQTSAWIPAALLEEGYPEAKVSDVEEVRIHSPHRDTEARGSFGAVIDRKVFEKSLALEAVEAGADVWVGSPVRGFLKERGKVSGVRIEAGGWSEEVEGDLVVDATGASSEWSSVFLTEVLESGWDDEKRNQTNEYLMANSEDGGSIDLYFDSLVAPGGYAWIHPLERKFAMAGIRGVRIHPDSALDEFLGRDEPDRLRDGVPIGEYRGQLPVEGPLENTVADGVLTVGSAAGQVYPLSGHGMKYALEGGEIAAEVAVEAVRAGDFSRKKLEEYDRRWRDSFGGEIEAGGAVYDSLQVSPDQKMDALLEFLEDDPEYKSDFVNLFTAREVWASLEKLLQSERFREIIGEEKARSMLSLVR